MHSLPESAALEVCLEGELVTVNCAYERCHKPFQKRATNKRKMFCCTNCRVNASREPQRAKHWRWDAAKNFHRVMEFVLPSRS